MTGPYISDSTAAQHKVGTREEWLAARLNLLEEEKEHTRRGDELAQKRLELPWVRVDKGYRFETMAFRFTWPTMT